MAFDIQALLRQLQESYTRQNTDSLAQYQNLMRGVNDAGSRIAGTFGGIYKNLEGQGATEMGEIDRNTVRNKASSSQDLTNRGLGNTTITATNNRGIEEDATRAKSAVNERVAGQKANVGLAQANSQMGVANLWANSVLSRNNQGPDMGMYSNLISALTANGGLSGASGGGGGGRSYSFAGGVPHGPMYGEGSGSTGGGGGGEAGGGGSGVQTFTNPGATGGVITQQGYPRPGTPAYNRLGLSQRVQANQFWQNQAQA